MNNRVCFLHPNLGIGGAERAIVDAAIALKSKNYDVTIVTNYHDKNHCFEETKNGDLRVIVIGDFIPSSFFGRFCALLAYFKLVFAAYFVLLFYFNEFDLFYVDQISAPVPVLRIFGYKVLFYAHFPDLLLSKGGGFFKQLYRYPINFIEKFSLSYADVILYNSKFTADVYKQTFDFVNKTNPKILYPVPNIDNLISSDNSLPSSVNIDDNSLLFLSINRYEEKKNIELALKAFASLRKEMINSMIYDKLLFVHFGGYDELVPENKMVFDHLTTIIESLEIGNCALLLKSCSNNVKVNFLKRATALLYTPSNEHFGIVPIEAMYLKCPVIAVNNGGPLETVIDGETGFLCESHPEPFFQAMKRLCLDKNLKIEMGNAGHERVCKEFSFRTFQQSLSEIVSKLLTE